MINSFHFSLSFIFRAIDRMQATVMKTELYSLFQEFTKMKPDSEQCSSSKGVIKQGRCLPPVFYAARTVPFTIFLCFAG